MNSDYLNSEQDITQTNNPGRHENVSTLIFGQIRKINVMVFTVGQDFIKGYTNCSTPPKIM